MTFDEILTQVLEVLQREGRVSYGALKRRFNLDEAYLADLKDEIIAAKQLAMDEGGKVLVWLGNAGGIATRDSGRPPRAIIPQYLSEKILTSRTALEGERKQITVLFADIQSSTELIAGLDPEEARRLLDPALHIMMDAVHRFEGTVNQVLGDGIMALFGAPLAHEDHAIRACYAAIAMQHRMQQYAEQVRREHGIAVRLRVGLNSGEVVVRAIGNDLHMDYSAIGQTTHLAARMEQLAAPGSILVSAATLRLVEGLVQVNALGSVPIKGVSMPVEVFELVGASATSRRLQATALRGLTRFVGRQDELHILQQAQEQAWNGHGRAVLLIGEPGVGKSRLLYECLHSHRTRDWMVLESAAVSYGQTSAYFPIIELLKQYFAIESRDETRAIRAKVTGHVLTLDEALQEHIPALLSLLDVLPARSPFRTLEPLHRRQRTLDALQCLLLRESEVQPVLLVCEDLQWVDSETQALLDSMLAQLDSARLFLLMSCRPEYQHTWTDNPSYTEVHLAPLPPENAEQLLHSLLGEDAALAVLKHDLIACTEGNPFFLEECVRTLVETQELVGTWGAYRLAHTAPAIQLPATVQAVLAARIDRLPAEAKRLLQAAAVIGSEIPLPLLQAIARLPEETLHSSLAHLQEAGFLHETGLFPEVTYGFRHTLTLEVAYSSLLQERRRLLHTEIVSVLETLASDRLIDQLELLAHHALRGEVWPKALTYCQQAGLKAMERSAHREAAVYFEHALDALTHLSDSPETRQQAIDLRFDLRNALMPLGELGRISDVLRAAARLAEDLEDRQRLGQVAAYMSSHYFAIGEHTQAITAAERAMAVATANNDFGLEVVANLYQGFAYHAMGDYYWAMDFLRRNIATLIGPLAHEHFGQVGLVSVLSRTWLVSCLAEVGAFQEAREHAQEAILMAETAQHPFSMALAFWAMGFTHLRQGELATATPFLERSLAIAQHASFSVLLPLTRSTLGFTHALAGHLQEALPLLEDGLQHAKAIGLRYVEALCLHWLGTGLMLTGRLPEAQVHATHALEVAQAHEERGYQAYALYLLGSIAACGPRTQYAQAVTTYDQAIALARELGMRPLLARGYFSLGMLYGHMQHPDHAARMLALSHDLYQALAMPSGVAQVDAVVAQLTATAGHPVHPPA